MSARNDLEERVRARLNELQASGVSRALRSPSGVDLSSNDYLGLARHPAIIARLRAAVVREGCGSTGSRLLRGERDCFDAVERRFAQFKHTERSLFFGSGYLANIGVLSTLPDSADIIFSDERNHASLIDGMRLSRARTVVFPHNDVGVLARLLDEAPAAAGRFVVVESLFSMDGDFAPLAEYAELCRSTRSSLIVDEAHAVGIYGEGRGLIEAAGVANDVLVSINTAGKALGVAGAFVAGPSWAVEYLVQRARSFIYSTAPPPALADALDASLTVIEKEPERRTRLATLVGHVRSGLRTAGFDVPASGSQIIPLIVGDNQRAVAMGEALQRDGFDVRAIRPPSVPPGTARLRVSINTSLSEPLLQRFVETLKSVSKEAGLCSAASS